MIKGVRLIRRLALLAVSLQMAGCADLGINDERRTTIWNGDLRAEPAYTGLSGRAAALSQASGTQATILLEGAPLEDTFAWGLWLGTCENPEQQIAPDTEYPELVVDGEGEATADASLGPMLELDRNYHVEARTLETDAARVACGDLAAEPGS